jgi:hypothetical protein
MTPFACKLLLEHDLNFRKANVKEGRVFVSQFPGR